MSGNSCQVGFLDRTVAELLLQISGGRGATRGDQQAAGIGVQAMHQSNFLWMVCMLHGRFERVFEVATAGVNRQRCRLIENQPGVGLVDQVNLTGDGRLRCFRFAVQQFLSFRNDSIGGDAAQVAIEQSPRLNRLHPMRSRPTWDPLLQEIQQRYSG